VPNPNANAVDYFVPSANNSERLSKLPSISNSTFSSQSASFPKPQNLLPPVTLSNSGGSLDASSQAAADALSVKRQRNNIAAAKYRQVRVWSISFHLPHN